MTNKPECSIHGCEKPIANKRGWCGKHYDRWWRHGDPTFTTRFPPETPLIDRIEATGWDVDDGSGCWIWRGRVDWFGYPMIKFNAKQTRVHRAIWEIHNGIDFPANMNALHSCDTPSCMNPEHIRPGTQVENIADMVAKGRQVRAPGSNLTEHDIREIRRRVASGERQIDVARELGIDTGTMSKIINRKLFKWVDWQPDTK